MVVFFVGNFREVVTRGIRDLWASKVTCPSFAFGLYHMQFYAPIMIDASTQIENSPTNLKNRRN